MDSIRRRFCNMPRPQQQQQHQAYTTTDPPPPKREPKLQGLLQLASRFLPAVLMSLFLFALATPAINHTRTTHTLAESGCVCVSIGGGGGERRGISKCVASGRHCLPLIVRGVHKREGIQNGRLTVFFCTFDTISSFILRAFAYCHGSSLFHSYKPTECAGFSPTSHAFW